MPQEPLNNQNNESTDYLGKLKADLALVEEKNRKFNSDKAMNDNKFNEATEKLKEQLFIMMKDLGVDPSNRESIKEFLEVKVWHSNCNTIKK